jgi:CRISPR-associated protein Csb3
VKSHEVTGRIDEALGHMTLFGLAAIVEAVTGKRCRISWTNAMVPRPLLHTEVGWSDVCEAVLAHARQVTSTGQWLTADVTVGAQRHALFSPRVAAIADEHIGEYYRKRWEVVRGLGYHPVDLLSAQQIGSLGSPAYWSEEKDRPKSQDYGASRWEMKTRNRGEEFVRDRFRTLGLSVAGSDVTRVSDSLQGRVTLNAEGKPSKSDDRAATGLRAPGPVDSLVAWTALWGVSQLGLMHEFGHVSHSAGFLGRFASGSFFVPVWNRATALARVRSVTVSRQLRDYVEAELSGGDVRQVDSTEYAAGVNAMWLRMHGVAAVATFRMNVTGNKSAPERWAEVGRLLLLPPTIVAGSASTRTAGSDT